MSVNWPLNEWQLVLATAICLDVVILVLIVTVLRKTKVSRAECARLGQGQTACGGHKGAVGV